MLRKLQAVLNASVRLISSTRKFDHITPVMKDLHWLPVKQRIKFKLLLTVYKCINGMAPRYLQNKLNQCNNSKLRSSNMKLLKVPKSITKSYGDRRFSVADPKYWNLLPKDIRLSPSLDIFKSKLKTFLFTEAYGTWAWSQLADLLTRLLLCIFYISRASVYCNNNVKFSNICVL